MGHIPVRVFNGMAYIPDRVLDGVDCLSKVQLGEADRYTSYSNILEGEDNYLGTNMLVCVCMQTFY